MLCSVDATGAIRTRAQKEVSDICRQEPLRSGVYGVLAVRMNGDTLVSINPGQKMVPASTAKLVTTGVALKTLGPDFRFRTGIGYVGTVTADSTLVGDVFIIGGGDPTTGSSNPIATGASALFAKWARFLRDAGIGRVQGRIIGDPRYFKDPDPVNPGWLYEDVGLGYGAAPSGLNFHENILNFKVAPGAGEGSHPIVTQGYPKTPWMSWRNSTISVDGASADAMYCITSGFGPYLEFVGKFPVKGIREYTLECANRFGAYTCASLFCDYLCAHGLSVSDGAGDVSPAGYIRTELAFGESESPYPPHTFSRTDMGYNAQPSAAPAQGSITLVGSTVSPTLSEIVRETNCKSDNFYAETLARMISLRKSRSVRYDSCSVAIVNQLGALGIRTTNNCQIYDGSGLSRKNYFSPRFLVAFLRAMAKTNVFNEFFDSLPVPGEEKTTLSTRMKTAPDELKARIHMKSGSMNGVRCFSGYITTPDIDPRRTVVFAVMTNNVTAGSTTVYSMLEDIIFAIAEEN